eukprot:jgi/Mesvir1/12243/Mv00461-RA.1
MTPSSLSWLLTLSCLLPLLFAFEEAFVGRTSRSLLEAGNAQTEGYCFVEGCNFEQYSVKPVLGSTVLAMDKENITVSNETYSRWYLAGAGQAWKKVSNVNGVWIPKTDNNFRIIFRNTGIGGPGMMHAHGQTPVVSVDGVPYISGMPIYHNRESLYVYELHPQNGGSYLIHSHYGWGHDQGLGVPLIVERDPPVDYPGRADLLSAKQALFWFEELCPYHLFQTPELECSAAAIFAAGTPFSGPNNDLGLGGYRHYLVNHHTLDDPWVEHVEAGNKTLLRLISSSTHSNLKCSLGTLGIATIVAADGQWVQPVPVTEFWLGVAQRLDILISNPVEPGAYPLVCAETSLPWITDRKKAGIVFVVGGAAYVPAPRTYDVGHSNGCASGVPEGTDGCAGAYLEMTHDTEKLLHAYYPLEAGPADVELTLNLTTTIMCDFATNLTSCTPENPIFRFGFDDQPWFTTPLGNDKPFVPNPNPIKVQLNQKVCINMVNKAAGDHIIHMHGHHFQVVEVDGQPIPGGGAMRDTVLVGDSYLSPQFVGQQRNWTTHINSLQNYPFKNTKICFLADNPGIWALHCHYSMHLVSGMMTTVEYTSSDSDPKPVRGCTNTNDEAFTLEATVDDGSCAGSNICANFDDNLPFAGLRQRFLRPPPALGSDFTDMKDELVVGADVLTLTHESMTLPNGFSYSKHRVEGKGPHFKTISNVGTLIMSTTTAHFRVLYRNKLNEPAIMHAHGLTPVHNLDGVSYLTSMPIQADRENLYVYELHPQNAGTYILHAHYGWGHDEGLAIPLVVQRPPPSDYPLVNELNNAIESIMFFEELCPYHKDPSKHVAPWECNAAEILKEGVFPLGPWHDLGLGGFRYYLANKRVLDNPWVEHMPAGAKVRLRMVNAAVESLFRCHLGALAPAQAVAVDGQWVHPVNLTDARNSLWVGTGQRLDLLLTMPNASGAYPLICDETNLPWIRDRKHVGVVFVVGGDAYVPAPGTYDVGHTKGCPPVENQDEFTAADGCNATNVDFLVMPHDLERKLHAFFPLSFVKNPIPVKEVTLNLTSEITCDPFVAPENCTRETPFLQFSFNYHRMGLPPGPVLPNDKPFLPNPVPIEVELGETVCINIVNRAAGDHIIHMHGHHFQVVELDGVPIPGGGAMRDTVMVSDSDLSEYFPLFTGFRSAVEQRSEASLKNTKICFLADNPGVWAIHCHFNMHATMGMLTTIEYNAGKNDPPARYGCDNPDAANFVPGATSKGVANAEDLCFFYECLDDSGPTDGSLTFAFYLLGVTYERYVFSGGPGTLSAWIQDDVASYFNVARNAVSVPRTFTANQTEAPADAIYSEVVVRLPGGASPDGVLAKVRQLDTAADATFAFPVVGGYSGGTVVLAAPVVANFTRACYASNIPVVGDNMATPSCSTGYLVQASYLVSFATCSYNDTLDVDLIRDAVAVWLGHPPCQVGVNATLGGGSSIWRRLLQLGELAEDQIEIAIESFASSELSQQSVKGIFESAGFAAFLADLFEPFGDVAEVALAAPVREVDLGSAKSDPHFVSARGDRFDFVGRAERSYCVLSDERVHVNARLMGAESDKGASIKAGDTSVASKGASARVSKKADARTWMDQISVMYGSDRVLVDANSRPGTPYAASFGTVLLNGAPLEGELGTRQLPSGLVVTRRRTRVYISALGKMEMVVEVVRASFWEADKGPGKNFLNFQVKVFKAAGAVHGILGQSFSKQGAEMPMEGSDEDYVTSGMFAADCRFAKFVPQSKREVARV